MANGDQAPGGQGGGQRIYSEEDVMALMNEAARRGASEAMKGARKRDEDEDDTSVSVINPKVVKQLKDTVAVFTALKELSSNPLQKTIEETVGGMAASVVQSAFAPRGPPPKQDIVEKLLNSQFAYGLGSGMGQRAPELVETMGRTFGTDRAGQMMDNIIGKTGGGQGGLSKQLNPGPSSGPSPGPSGPSSGSSSGPSSPSSTSEQDSGKQSEKELLLSLDPNNPEHVSAYAETQGGLPVDVARKMLMIHQDAFIEQLKRDGMNIDQISTQRGSRASGGSPAQPSPAQQTPPVPPVQPVSPPPIRQNIPPTYPDSHPDSPIEQPSHQSPDDTEYAEYHDIMQPGQNPGPQPNPQHSRQPVSPPPTRQGIPPTYPDSHPGSSIKQPSPQFPDDTEYAEYNDMIQQDQGPGSQPSPRPGHQSVSPGNVDGQQVEMMKTFATDIGKVMGEMLNKIETLNNTVFTLQSEMNDIKKQGPKQPQPVSTDNNILSHREMSPIVHTRVTERSPGMTNVPSPIAYIETPSLETFEDQVTETPKVELDIERSEDFFEENVMDISDFQQELDREAKLSATNSNMLLTDSKAPSQKTQRQAPLPELVQSQPAAVPPAPVAQPVPPTIIQPISPPVALPTPPIAQIIKPVSQPPVVQQSIALPVQHIRPSATRPVEQSTKEENITKKEEDIVEKEENIVEKEENIVETPKIELGESIPKDIDIDNLKEIPIIPNDKTDDKTSKDKTDDKFVTSTNEQLKLSKKTGVHKKAKYRNIKPSFKKNSDEENKEENNIDREV